MTPRNGANLLKPTMLTPSMELETPLGHGQVDDCPYSTILDRQNDFYYKGFADWCAARDGALPRRDGSTSEERSLASWFRHKLRLYYSDDLSDEELVKLKKIPAINEHICLHGQWSLKFVVKNMNFEDWCAKHRRLLPQQAGGTGEESSLADWLKNAISSHHHGRSGKHSENKLPFLRKISVPVDIDVFRVKNQSLSRSERFDLKHKKFEDWCAAHHGTLPGRHGDTQEERSLAIWFKNKLYRYRCGRLSFDQQAKLREIPAVSELFSVQGKAFRSFEHFALKCKSVKHWCAQHRESLPKQRGDTQEERSLGIWLMNQLARYRRGRLSVDQQNKLREIPVISEVLNYKDFADWCAVHDGTLPRKNGPTWNERSLACWFKQKLHLYRSGKVSDDQLAQMKKIPAICDLFTLQARSLSFALKCKNFEDWCTVHNGNLPKHKGDSAEERSLANWLCHKLHSYRNGKLTDDQLAHLRSIPVVEAVFTVEGRSLSYAERFALKCKSFEDWCAQHSGSLPKQTGDTQEERSLAMWFKDKLFSFRHGKLSDDQLALLRKIPAISEVFSVQGKSFQSPEHFALQCKSLEDWCAQHGGDLPKHIGYTREERSLANWLMYKLRRYRHGKLSKDQLAKLRTIPEVANMFESSGT